MWVFHKALQKVFFSVERSTPVSVSTNGVARKSNSKWPYLTTTQE